ncbi:hypothetical protein TEA_026264 [Camellia sinensis var. sinensis]|uniref:Aconitase/3-isopropylmalate dehydratase large subunit alpha/beta/alpha domain-containing protein n=1 Tax=Camellia sinensis var. sinensis TaxID=542762 RepID=A0A4S4DE69_CAMSN|nr:hypothetical protein TEA_026264 [Camellia sinensis var. sinensis]
MKNLVRAYFEEAKWFHQGYVPSMEEYMRVALVTCGYTMQATTSFVGMREVVYKEAFDWVSSDPLIVQASSLVNRLMDDMVSHEWRYHISFPELSTIPLIRLRRYVAFGFELNRYVAFGFELNRYVAFGFELNRYVAFGFELNRYVAFGFELNRYVAFGFELNRYVAFGFELNRYVAFGFELNRDFQVAAFVALDNVNVLTQKMLDVLVIMTFVGFEITYTCMVKIWLDFAIIYNRFLFQGIDIKEMLAGASLMDEGNRATVPNYSRFLKQLNNGLSTIVRNAFSSSSLSSSSHSSPPYFFFLALQRMVHLFLAIQSHAILRYLACAFPGVVDHCILMRNLKMNYCDFQHSNAFMSPNQEIIGSISIPDWKGSVVCPIPRRVALLTNNPMRPLRCHVSHQAEVFDSKAGAELLDIILKWKLNCLESFVLDSGYLGLDFTGVPAVVNLACMCDAMNKLGSNSNKINPLVNKERFSFLKWGSSAFHNMLVVPPCSGIVHQVNLEYLGRVVFNSDGMLYPDSVVGTDSHTTILDGLGVAGWGVGCIEAEAVMLGQHYFIVTALFMVIVPVLLAHSFSCLYAIEVPGEASPPSPYDICILWATIANMSPEYGATIGFFPVDKVVLICVKIQVAMIEAYLRANNMFVDYNERNLISTPPTSGTILPGITRKTVIDIARDHGFHVVILATQNLHTGLVMLC